MPVHNEAMPLRDLVKPRFTCRREVNRFSARLAHEVVVMLRGRTSAEEPLVVYDDNIDLATTGHRVQVPVNRRQADRLTGREYLPMQVSCRDETRRIVQTLLHQITLRRLAKFL